MKIKAREFSNNDITITYDPFVCSLSGTCVKALPEIFSNKVIPWINIENAEPTHVINQIKKCPSGALQYSYRVKKKAS
ncbi:MULTISPECIES: (4Fe-4S)-binding protein [unclassified Algibacter]|uniref:(4Fe-4S)-binding protein n=1 Tax=unclassified Algibacter TaxID=2615009 RepID=UPI00131A793E|nr:MULTISPECIES: (4Fe-4S)-binding protein [unclassified Algibacter]MCL5129940.1 (4Fe-4S)-binding protein [Algibacter sp. L4_22]